MTSDELHTCNSAITILVSPLRTAMVLTVVAGGRVPRSIPSRKRCPRGATTGRLRAASTAGRDREIFDNRQRAAAKKRTRPAAGQRRDMGCSGGSDDGGGNGTGQNSWHNRTVHRVRTDCSTRFEMTADTALTHSRPPRPPHHQRRRSNSRTCRRLAVAIESCCCFRFLACIWRVRK